MTYAEWKKYGQKNGYLKRLEKLLRSKPMKVEFYPRRKKI